MRVGQTEWWADKGTETALTLFWIVAGAVVLVVAALLVMALLRGERATGPAEAYDLQVYRDQLREIERDAARGTIAPEEAERLKTEVSRRILAADARIQGGAASASRGSGPGKVMAAVIVLALIGGSSLLYLRLGAPGYGDLSFALRSAERKSNTIRAKRRRTEDTPSVVTIMRVPSPGGKQT